MRFIKLATLIIYILINGCSAFSQNTNNDEDSKISLFVEANISTILNKIPDNYEPQYGFANRGEFDFVTVGKPIQLYTINDTVVYKQLQWRVPIIVNGEYRALLTVQKTGNKYIIGDFGAAVLANDIQQKASKYLDENTICILRAYAIGSDFVIIKNSAGDILIPLTSAENYFDSKKIELKPFYTISEIKDLQKHR